MFLKYLKEYAIMTLGLAVFVFGWTAFLNPHEITGGGIAGLASVIHYGIDSIPVSYAKFAIDILLLVAGFIILGKGFGIKTIYCVAMSFVFFQFMPMIPGLTSISAGITDNLINALIGGAMSGIGIAIIITQGGSTGGTDIIALSINKYKNISPGRIYLVCDSLIVMSILLVNDKTLADVVYGFVEIIAFSYAVDMFLTGSQQSVQRPDPHPLRAQRRDRRPPPDPQHRGQPLRQVRAVVHRRQPQDAHGRQPQRLLR